MRLVNSRTFASLPLRHKINGGGQVSLGPPTGEPEIKNVQTVRLHTLSRCKRDLLEGCARASSGTYPGMNGRTKGEVSPRRIK